MGSEEASRSEAHRGHFGLADEQAVAFNKEQRVVIAGHDVAPQVRPERDFCAVGRSGMFSAYGRRAPGRSAAATSALVVSTSIADGACRSPRSAENAFSGWFDPGRQVVAGAILPTKWLGQGVFQQELKGIVGFVEGKNVGAYQCLNRHAI